MNDEWSTLYRSPQEVLLNYKISALDCRFSEKMDNFSPIEPVFIEPEVRSQFISFVNSDNRTDTNDVSETEIWKWLRTPPLETIVRCLILILLDNICFTDGYCLE